MLSFHPPAPSDYTTVTTMLTFNAGSTNQTVMLPIIDNMVEEVTKSFTVSLSNTAGDGAVMLNPSTTTVTIQDDDSKLWYKYIRAFFSVIHAIKIGQLCYVSCPPFLPLLSGDNWI